MSRNEKDPATFRKKILRWYERHARELLWRNSRDPYKIWVSEVMLQQTTVQAVLPYYQEWMKTFPDIESLSRAPSQKVLKTWQGLGYYQRAKNLHKASKIIVDKHQGLIPQDYDELRDLPGFGPYITAAVLSIAFDRPFPVMDANVRRVLMRIMGARGKADAKMDQKLLSFLKPYFPQKKAAVFNQALMELGALVCRPKNPSCLLCPLSDFCQAFKDGNPEVIPRPKKREYRKIDAVVAVVEKNGRLLIQKRPPQGLLADLWEFPGGKRKTGETLEETLQREIMEELQSQVLDPKLLIKVRHAYTQYQVSLYAFQCRLAKDPNLSKNRHRWVTLPGLRDYPFPSGSAKIIKFLEQRAKAKKQI
ncbi:MAG: A/G-specific adenine glycosylase [Candidatus Aminicenantes bacterium]|nr:A/G-specific adenine glycosylase [Candidatus Aminicenantes bacterium]